MKCPNPSGTFYVPDGVAREAALARCTHLAIGAHQDDLEFMALHGILACHGKEDRWFGGVTCTDGGGSPRTGPYEDTTDEEMILVRRNEQDRAAKIGGYTFAAQLAWPSADLRGDGGLALAKDLSTIVTATKPEVVYTHSPADRHETHVTVALAALHAIRSLPRAQRPERFLGCEAWGSLDWLDPRDRVVLDVSGHDELARALVQVFVSQIRGGKRYDLAVEGRQRANATFTESHAVDDMSRAWLAVDLSALLRDDTLDPEDFLETLLERFTQGIHRRLRACIDKRKGC